MKTLSTRSTRSPLATLAMLALAAATTGCLGFDYVTCDEVQDSCEEFLIVTCDKVERCGGDFDACVGALFDDGFDCDSASDLDEDPEDCFDDIDAMSCEDLVSGDSPRSCDGISFEFDEDVCN